MKLKIPKIPKVEMFGIDIIKNAMFFAGFIIIFLILLSLIVAPSIKKFKATKTEFYKTKLLLNQTNSQLDKKINTYNKLFKENKRIISAFKKEFSKDNFKYFSANFMQINSIEDKNISIYKKDFIKKTYIITASLKSPLQFYKFVEETKKYKNIVQIYFPIVFKSSDGKLKLLYKLEHFKVK